VRQGMWLTPSWSEKPTSCRPRPLARTRRGGPMARVNPPRRVPGITPSGNAKRPSVAKRAASSISLSSSRSIARGEAPRQPRGSIRSIQMNPPRHSWRDAQRGGAASRPVPSTRRTNRRWEQGPPPRTFLGGRWGPDKPGAGSHRHCRHRLPAVSFRECAYCAP
jgi:hypothetical protein